MVHINLHVSRFTFHAMRLAFCVLFALLALVGAVRAGAQSANQQTAIAVSARAGYGDTGAYLIGEWLPVRVTLDNAAGGTSRHVRVQVTSKGPDDSIDAGIYARDLDLPASSHKEVTLYAYSGTYTRQFSVAVVDGGSVLANVKAEATPYEPPANLIVGIISSDPSMLNVLNGEQVGHVVNALPPGGYGGYSGYVPYLPNTNNAGSGGNAAVAHMKPADIPDLSQALNSLGAIVVDDVDTGALSPDQRSALDGWVSRGGMLIVASRPGGEDVTAGIGDLLPVTVAGSRTISSLDSLRTLVDAAASPSGAASVAVASVRPEAASTSRLLAQQDGIPVIVERELGLGQVVYMAISPGVAPLKSWDGMLPLMKRLLADHPLRSSYGDYLRFSPARGYYSGSVFGGNGGMFAIPSLDLPDATVIGFFLFVYILIIGPVNFITLRRLRRTELAWVTVPALVLVFSVVAYVLAFQSKGGDLVAIRANVVNTYPGSDQATISQHFGLFSPVRRTYTLQLPADAAVTEMSRYGYYQAGSDTSSAVLGGNPTIVSNVNIDTWSLKAFVAEHSEKAQSPVETHLQLGDNAILGTVKNVTTGPLDDVALVRGDAVRYVGYLAPGAQKDVRLAVSSGRFDNSSPVKLLPVPPGVIPPSFSSSSPYTGSQANTVAQRTYNRKVELLSVGLYPLVADQAPSDMSVIVLAWGPPLPANFEVEDHGTSTEELNMWAGVASVSSPAANEQPALHAGVVPYTLYAPGNNPPVLTWTGGGPLSSPGGPLSVSGGPAPVPSAVPTVGSGTQQFVPPAVVAIGGSAVQSLSVHVSPYADVSYRLPAGIKPDKLALSYDVAQASTTGDIELLAYNVITGTWDSAGTMQTNNGTQTSTSHATVPIANPANYTGPAGDVTIRLLPVGGDTTLTNLTLNLELNGK
jgi:hypothetical protein